MAELFWNTVKKTACKKMKTEKRLLFHPGAPIWAASWSGIPTNKAGTAPVTDPGLTGREICWKGLPKPASPILKKALLDICLLYTSPHLGSAFSLVLMVLILLCMSILNQFNSDEDREGMLL